ncbi:YceI family protein [Angustibacter speluncae]
MTDTTSTTTATQLPEGLVPGTYAIDASHSEVGFVARHAMVTKVRGRFTEVEGSLTFGDSVETSSANATIGAASVTTGSEQRDGHLQSPDFFDVATYPTITFASTGVRAEGGEFVLEGDLTIKDVTKRVTVPVEFEGTATDPFGNQRAGFSAAFDVDREDWGLTWNAALETGGVLVSKKVRLQLDISAIKQA